MTEHTLNSQPVAPPAEAALDEDQRAYESLFGLVPEWHQTSDPDAPAAPAPADDDDLYRALFGA